MLYKFAHSRTILSADINSDIISCIIEQLILLVAVRAKLIKSGTLTSNSTGALLVLYNTGNWRDFRGRWEETALQVGDS